MGGGIQEHRERKGKEKGVGGNGLCSNLRRMPPAEDWGHWVVVVGHSLA